MFFLKNWLNEWCHCLVQNKNPAMNDITARYKIRIRQFTSYQGCRILTTFIHPDRTVQRCDCREKILKGVNKKYLIKHWYRRSKDVKNSHQMEQLFCPQTSWPKWDFELEFRNLLQLLWGYYRRLECHFRPVFGAPIPLLYSTVESSLLIRD